MDEENPIAEQLKQLRELIADNQQQQDDESKKEQEIRAILDELIAKRRKHLDKLELLKSEQRSTRYQLADAERQYKIKAAEQERLKALEPHFDHPRLQFVLRLLEKHPKYEMLKTYQKEDLVFMLDRYLFPLKTKGVLNGNDTGLGKTAETAFLLWTMEQWDARVQAGEVPEELLT